MSSWIGQTINGGWKIKAKLGSGTYGEVLLVTDVSGFEYAAKIEYSKSKDSNNMENEFRVLSALKHERGFPSPLAIGKHQGCDYIVMQCLGDSAYDVLERRRSCTLPFRDICNIAVQAIGLLQRMHAKGFIHRDVKPGNIVFGRTLDTSKHIFLIDFGSAAVFRDPISGTHVPYSSNAEFVGTRMYASVNALLHVQQSRRDDLMALGYSLIDMAKGTLPWEGSTTDSEEETEMEFEELVAITAEKKCETSLRELCSGLPTGVFDYMQDVSALDFAEDPDYNGLVNLFILE